MTTFVKENKTYIIMIVVVIIAYIVTKSSSDYALWEQKCISAITIKDAINLMCIYFGLKFLTK